MPISDVLDRVLDELGNFVGALEPDRVATDDATALLERFAAIERRAAAGRILLAYRAAEGNTWMKAGHRHPASWLAEVAGTGVGDGLRTLAMSERGVWLPDTQDALRQGRLSPQQAHEITSAAHANPSAEFDLLAAAEVDSLKQLKERARKAKARALSDEELAEREDRIERTRFLRTWTDDEGAMRLDAKVSPVAGARFMAALEAEAKSVFDEARAQGRQESEGAYLVDALLRLVTRPGDGEGTSKVVVHLRAPLAAFLPGDLAEGEDVCEIPGIGPVSRATAERLLGPAYLKLFITDGVDVQSVVHLGRAVPAHVLSALEERDPICVVPGCMVARGLEIDHWKVPFAEGGPTALWNLARLCRHHHQLKTYRGWELVGGPGKWEFRKPGEVWEEPPPTSPMAGGRWEPAPDGELDERLDFDGL